MKITCTKENLARALSILNRTAGKNNNLPILQNILFRATTQKVELISTNLELAITVNVRAKTEEEGQFTAPAKTLTEFIGLLPEGTIDLSIDGNELVVKCGRSSTKIKGTSAEDFPVLPATTQGNGFVVDASSLRGALLMVAQAMAKTEIRPELSGMLFAFNTLETGLVLAATDSYRLAEKKISLTQGKEQVQVIVPGHTAQEIAHILSLAESQDGEMGVRLLVNENQIAVMYGNVEMISRVVDGKYPDYRQIIPREFGTTAECDTNQLVKEIKAASLFSVTGINGILLDLNAEEETIGISSTSAQTGEYFSEVPATVVGNENSMLLNFRYLLEGLGNISTPTTRIQVVSGDSPCVLRPQGDESYLYIVMPIRK